jgi:hypothetical protein
LAARIGAFESQLCYAKITPAALQRGECRGQCRESAEAAGANPKFGLSGCSRVNPEAALPGRQAPLMAPS